MHQTLKKKLFLLAKEAREKAYAPYSNYQVGAALLTKDGSIYAGFNIENAGYSPTIHAEQTALIRALGEGKKDFTALLVLTQDGGAPCGLCRLFLAEFIMEPEQFPIFMADLEGKIEESTLAALYPQGFGPKNLHGQS